MPPIPQPSGKLIILPSIACTSTHCFFSLALQVSSETSQPSREGEIKLTSGVRAVFVFQSEPCLMVGRTQV